MEPGARGGTQSSIAGAGGFWGEGQAGPQRWTLADNRAEVMARRRSFVSNGAANITNRDESLNALAYLPSASAFMVASARSKATLRPETEASLAA